MMAHFHLGRIRPPGIEEFYRSPRAAPVPGVWRVGPSDGWIRYLRIKN